MVVVGTDITLCRCLLSAFLVMIHLLPVVDKYAVDLTWKILTHYL